ncbi:molybdopterin molybdotransferase MoeA [Citricoccus sp. NR2]|uniref:molybdopterin molybdotransferase MoeA n=1 Tax=Citricoccus sp. NR2 TaxID=3004095 RepID=UPI0022DDFA6F|nr:gephyrin-like molybdotransferase Glp [Citricoccus sp. NR2]WBL19844.1 molybdopterin molybdotransferase MoeA [Citricoccus sp. NR2]
MTEPRTVEDHLAEVTALLAPVVTRLHAAEPQLIPLDAAVGRVCARSITAPADLPPVDNSQMDGYAVRVADLTAAVPNTETTVTGVTGEASEPASAPRSDIQCWDMAREKDLTSLFPSLNAPSLPLGLATAAGDPPATHIPGTASPVMTGAPIPAGADAVVPVEATTTGRFPALTRHTQAPTSPEGTEGTGTAPEPAHTARTAQIGITEVPAPGAFIRRRGTDIRAGQALFDAGTRLSPAHLGALAASGITTVPVRPRMRILVCTTGDELAPDTPDITALAPGRIHDANGPMLVHLLRDAGAEVTLARCPDDPAALLALVTEHTAPDLVVTSGGISAGAFEVVRDTFEPLGARFVSVALQPGGPQGLGALQLPGASTLPALCFPGNPVSTLLSALLFLVPTLRELAGRPARRTTVQRPLATDVDSPEHQLQLRRAVLETDGTVTCLPPGSHLLHNLATADLIAEIPLGVSHLPAGTPVTTWSLHD